MAARHAFALVHADGRSSSRQLRLIEMAASDAPEDRPLAAPTPNQEQTLAAYLLDLVGGSACFSCGEELVAAEEGILVCPACGASVRRPAA